MKEERTNERLLSSREVADFFGGLSPKTIERKAQRREIPGFKVGKFWRYRRSDLEAWITAQVESNCQACCKETSF